jgi:RNA polymerase sigma-70 factor (ECF subfamily)
MDDDVTRLAVAAREGDRRALDQFVRATQADVWQFCVHLAGRGPADDLTQEVYARALGALGSFRADAGARVWLLAIARRTCADHVRREVRRRRLGARLLGEARHQRDLVDDPARARALDALVETLPEAFRLAFLLTQVLGLRYAEAAAVCGCPVGTVRSRVARARESLVARIAASEAGGKDAV